MNTTNVLQDFTDFRFWASASSCASICGAEAVTTVHNKPDAPNPAITLQFQVWSQWRGVGEPLLKTAERTSDGVRLPAEASLRLNVKMRLGNIENVMLCSVTEAVDHLHCERLVVRQEFQLRIRESFSHRRIESDGLLGARFANPPKPSPWPGARASATSSHFRISRASSVCLSIPIHTHRRDGDLSKIHRGFPA